MFSRVKKMLKRDQKKRVVPNRPENYPSLPLSVESLSSSVKNNVVKLIEKDITAMKDRVRKLSGKNINYINGKRRASRKKKSSISKFNREFSQSLYGRPWETQVTKLEREIAYLRWVQKQWSNANTTSKTKQSLPNIKSSKIRKTLAESRGLKARFLETFRMLGADQAKAAYHRLLLIYHPNKREQQKSRGVININDKDFNALQEAWMEYSANSRANSENVVRNLYDRATSLLEERKRSEAERMKHLNQLTTIIMTAMHLQKKTSVDLSLDFDTLQGMTIDLAKYYKVKYPNMTQDMMMKKILKTAKRIESNLNNNKSGKISRFAKSVLSLARIDLKKDSIQRVKQLFRMRNDIDEMLRVLSRLSQYMRKRTMVPFIYKNQGEELLVDEAYINGLVGELIVMRTKIDDKIRAEKKYIEKKLKEGLLGRDLKKMYNQWKENSFNVNSWKRKNTGNNKNMSYQDVVLASLGPSTIKLSPLLLLPGTTASMTPQPLGATNVGKQVLSIVNKATQHAIAAASMVRLAMLSKVMRRSRH